MKELRIDDANSNQRFDKYLKRVLSEASTSFIYKMLRKKNITLNDKKADGSEKLNTGDIVKIWFSDETFEKMSGQGSVDPLFQTISSFQGDIDIIHEDDDMIIINKPSGIKSQKDTASDISINEMAIAYMIKSGQLTEESFKHFHPSICNRLDRNTSGIVLFAKNLKTAQRLGQALKERSCKKLYHAIVLGEIDKPEMIDGFLYKDEKTNKVTILDKETDDAKPIKTAYRPIKKLGNDLTLLEIHLITGRTHQIRAHLASINHPILGDMKYGNANINKRLNAKSQLLHAYSIEFDDGGCYEAKEPKEFNVYL
ncbi:23S rRNA pseudouridine955/2504/2580 synthase [Pseudobutyrivibrio sp. YE44]|uniref:RluA family pseudouridine synthase n=1 Tax=Pseudobutyrivibrio sp. YE44 TaxID=1520802 RepID=UPI00088239F3|nr:RluA family pseudouridine synthase [Pseudobutyrivibrio sp. YE44]SDB09315.1 23S rRNA pseudouridine955/2504/2580 synthase [Pseudobutyrivibrio sp. YE44]